MTDTWKANTWQLPFLPGYTFYDPLKQKHHVPQSLEITKGTNISKILPRTTAKQGIFDTECDSKIRDAASIELQYGGRRPEPKNLFKPAYVAYDKKVLRFNAWRRDDVPFEPCRMRYVDVYYYLEDDTLNIFEPILCNSGMNQGKIIRRQKFPKGHDGSMWNWRHLNIGVDITVYNQTYHLYNCDGFTRDFLSSEGIDINPEECPPIDEHTRRKVIVPPEPLIVKPMDNRAQFQFYDRKVLRFWGMWDDRDNMFGYLQPVKLHYYLGDDTLEIVEVHRPNDGRDPFPYIVNRQKVPYNRLSIPANFPLNYLEISEKECNRYLCPPDFGIGKTVSVLGRKIFLYDCDQFTQDYYRKNFGIEDFTPLKVTEEPPAVMIPKVPPYNGWGSYEDSLVNCFKLLPVPPKKPETKKYFHDQQILRFEARLDSVWPGDEERIFHISFFLCDDTLKIDELRIPNSGRIGGKFLERQRLLHPTRSRPEDQLISGDPCLAPFYYEAYDFYLGQVILATGRKFVITDADEYVLKYLEHNCDKYPPEAIEAHRNKVQANRSALCAPIGRHTRGYNEMSEDDLIELFRNAIIKFRSADTGRERINKFLDSHSDKPDHILKKEARRWLYDAEIPLDKDMLEALLEVCREAHGMVSLPRIRRILTDAKLTSNELSPSDLIEKIYKEIVDKHGYDVGRHRLLMFLDRHQDCPPVVTKDELRQWINIEQLPFEDDTLERVLKLIGVGQNRCNLNEFIAILQKTYDRLKLIGV